MIQLLRKYKMADGKLVETIIRVLVGANRDVAILADFGWDQVSIDALETAMHDFTDLPTDGELSAMMAEKTEAKNLLRKAATDYVRVEIMGRVAQRYGEDSRTYDRFRVSDIQAVADGEFVFVLKRVARQAGMLAAELAAKGLTPAHIAQVTQYALDFVDAIEAQDQAIDDRDVAVQTRIEAGNALYELLVQLANMGKRKWLNVDESRYNDYVLYPNQSAGPGEQEPPAQQVVESDVPAMSVVNLSLTGIDADTTLAVVNDGAAHLAVYFATMPTDPPPMGPGSTGIKLMPGESWTGTASQLGLQIPGREYLNVLNSEPMPGHVEVTAS